MGIYAILLRPHANARYQQALRSLAIGELTLMLAKAGVRASVGFRQISGLEWLAFEPEAATDALLDAIAAHSHLFFLARVAEDGAFYPLRMPPDAHVGADLPGVLKYKGKTNEYFIRFLLNMALCASSFQAGDALTALDPMCGRGTALFEAANRGWNCAGVDVQPAEIDEGYKYFKRYLEYHRIKHASENCSMTFRGKQLAVLRTLEYAQSAERFRAGQRRAVSMAALNGRDLPALFPNKRFHLLVADLPYGVQHAAVGARADAFSSVGEMMEGLLPAWRAVLCAGAGVAVSFNTHNIALCALREQFARHGFRVLSGGAYDQFEHWVEQAIDRDVVIATRA